MNISHDMKPNLTRGRRTCGNTQKPDAEPKLPQETFTLSDTSLSDPFGWNGKLEVAPQSDAKPEIRPQVQEAIDFLASADELRVIHTTRSARPKGPEGGFLAGRFAVGARKGDATKTFIMQTEGRVGHLQPVMPGQTQVDGFVAEVENPYSDVKAGSQFNESELEALTVAMMRKQPDAEPTKFASAIYSNGDQVKYTKAYIEALEI